MKQLVVAKFQLSLRAQKGNAQVHQELIAPMLLPALHPHQAEGREAVHFSIQQLKSLTSAGHDAAVEPVRAIERGQAGQK